MSRADLARLSGLTPTTVSAVTGELVADGMIEEAGRNGRTAGKPATLVSVVADARHVVCLDLAVTTDPGAVVNLACKPVIRRSVAPRSGNGTTMSGQAPRRARGRRCPRARRPGGAAAPRCRRASPGVVDTEGVVARVGPPRIRPHPARPVHGRAPPPAGTVANDAHAVALGELAFAPSTSGNLLLVRIAEGVGAGIVINHELFTGGHAAGEIGHVVVEPRGTCASAEAGLPRDGRLRTARRGCGPPAARPRVARRAATSAPRWPTSSAGSTSTRRALRHRRGARRPFRSPPPRRSAAEPSAPSADRLPLRLSDWATTTCCSALRVLVLGQELGVV